MSFLLLPTSWLHTNDLLVVWQVPCPAVYHAAGCVQVDPQEEAQVRPLEVVHDVPVVEYLQHVRDGEDGLADTLYVPVLTLEMVNHWLVNCLVRKKVHM